MVLVIIDRLMWFGLEGAYLLYIMLRARIWYRSFQIVYTVPFLRILQPYHGAGGEGARYHGRQTQREPRRVLYP